jgi:epoxyqueuosine reductase
MTSAQVKRIAHDCGFELAGIAAATPNSDVPRYRDWVDRGMAGEMSYLTDRRAEIRGDPRNLLVNARSILCVGKLYNGPEPYSTDLSQAEIAWISRYAWGDDYHAILRRDLEQVVSHLRELEVFDYKICIDTAPLLERSYARDAGLGWIGKNTCLINQHAGSWFFLAELITSLHIEPDPPVDNRCGTCTRCIDACPTAAIVNDGGDGWMLDSRLCISYLTIELRGSIPDEQRRFIGGNVFGCDICQDVCPWNRRAAMTLDSSFRPREIVPPLERLANLTVDEFRTLFRESPVARAKYSGFLRNVAVAMGNSGQPGFRPALERLLMHPDPIIAEHASWALGQLERNPTACL